MTNFLPKIFRPSV